MQKTTFTVQKMDCAAEEQLIRLKLEGFKNIVSLQFDIPNRRLDIYHTGDYKPIFHEINNLQLNTSFVESETADEILPDSKTASKENCCYRFCLSTFSFLRLKF